jgi:hypothetical protein
MKQVENFCTHFYEIEYLSIIVKIIQEFRILLKSGGKYTKPYMKISVP